MIVTITGGRSHFPDRWEMEMLMDLLRGHKATVVRTGGATGVDTAVFNLLANTRITIGTAIERVEKWMPNWKRYHGYAGRMRNRAMLTGNTGDGSGILPERSFIFTAGEPSQRCIAFSGGTGTMRCCEAARDLSIAIDYIYRSQRCGLPSG